MKRFHNEINVLRSLALLMVLFQHSLTAFQEFTNMFFCKIPYSTNSIVFMYLSGYLYGINREKYKEKGTLAFLKSKSRQLAIPYFFWTILLFGAVYIANQIPNLSGFMFRYGYAECGFGEYLIGIFTDNYVYAEHFWYIYYLFLIFLLCATFRFIKVDWRGLLAVLICYGIIAQVGVGGRILLKLLKMIVVFLLGQISSKKLSFKMHNKKMLCVSIVVFLLTFVDFHYLHFISIKWLRLLEDFALIWTSVLLVKELACILAKVPSINKIASWIAQRSYCIYLSHNPYFVGLVAALGKMMGLPAIFCIIFAIVIGILGPSGIYTVAKRSSILNILMLGEQSEQR